MLHLEKLMQLKKRLKIQLILLKQKYQILHLKQKNKLTAPIGKLENKIGKVSNKVKNIKKNK